MTHQPDGSKPGAQNQEDPGPHDRMPRPSALLQGIGALDRSRDKLGQERSESHSRSYLGRCQQMAPTLGSPAEVPESGREEYTHVCKHVGVDIMGRGCDNTNVHT